MLIFWCGYSTPIMYYYDETMTLRFEVLGYDNAFCWAADVKSLTELRRNLKQRNHLTVEILEDTGDE